MDNGKRKTECVEAELIRPDALDEYRLNFYGNKKNLLPKIAAAIPEETETIADIFSGTGIVSWYLKHQGYRMISNGIMRYPCIRMRALVENQDTALSVEEIEMLCQRNDKTDDEENYFHRYYRRTFGEENCRFLQTWASNMPKLTDPMKRDIAIYIPIVCISRYFSYAAIHWTTLGVPTGGKNLLNANLEKDVRKYALDIFPRFLFDNGQDNQVYNEDAVELVSKIDADVLYLDPPYAAKAGSQYEGNYSIFDDLVSILSGRGDSVVDPMDSKCELSPYTYFGTRKSALVGLAKMFERSSHIPTVIVSYNSTSSIDPEEIATLARMNGRDVEMRIFEDQYRPTVSKDAKGKTDEYLICCSARNVAVRTAA